MKIDLKKIINTIKNDWQWQLILVLTLGVIVCGSLLLSSRAKEAASVPETGELQAAETTAEPETEETAEPEEEESAVKTVRIGEEEVLLTTETLTPTDVEYTQLYPALLQLEQLKELDLRSLDLTCPQIAMILEAKPETEVRYDVSFRGERYPQNIEEITLPEIEPEQYENLASAVKLLPNLKTINLSLEEDGGTVDFAGLALVRKERPDVSIAYEFELFGKTVSLEETELNYRDQAIGDENVKILYDVIPCMTQLQRVVLDDCEISNEVMAELRDAFPEIKVVWRVHWSGFSVLTDTEVIRACGTSSGTDALKYCTETRYIDMGHSTELLNIEFTRYMPNLQILIVVDSAIETLEPLSGCKKLQMLEIVNCWALTDLSPLAECEDLQFLNISNCFGVRDISPIYGLKHLERLYCSQYKIPQEQIDEIRELMPDCWITFGHPGKSLVSFNYSIGWRLDAAPKVKSDWYNELLAIFGIGYNLYDTQGYFSYKYARAYDFPLDDLVIFARK